MKTATSSEHLGKSRITLSNFNLELAVRHAQQVLSWFPESTADGKCAFVVVVIGDERKDRKPF